MIEVVNIRNCSPKWGQPGDVKIDRTTSWGNPFPMHRESERDAVCDAYALYVMKMIDDGHLKIADLIHAKRLGCWCKPKRCHGDFLKILIEDEMSYKCGDNCKGECYGGVCSDKNSSTD